MSEFLVRLLNDAAQGRFPPADGSVTVVPQPSPPLPGPPAIDLAPEADQAHPRISRALRYRDEVRAWRADGGVVLLAAGFAPAGAEILLAA